MTPPGQADEDGLPPHPGRGDSLAAATCSPRITRRSLFKGDSDARLVELARAGDQRAFEVILERYRPALLVHSRGIVGDAAAQDVVQQASMRAWLALRGGRDVRHVRAWLFTIAHRAALETLRSEATPTAELGEALAGGLSPEELIEQSTRARATLTAVAELPPRERDALVWTSLHGRSGRDAAHALGVSEGAIRQLIVRARARARAAVGVFVPPALLARLQPLHRPRRLAALTQRSLAGAESAAGGEGLAWLAPVLAAGALVAAPVAAVHLAPDNPKPAATHPIAKQAQPRVGPRGAQRPGHLEVTARARRLPATAAAPRIGPGAARPSAPAASEEALRPSGSTAGPHPTLSTVTSQASTATVSAPALRSYPPRLCLSRRPKQLPERRWLG